MKKAAYLILLSLFIVSCSNWGHKALYRELDAMVGVNTYDEVLKGWERPDDIREEDGFIIVIWIRDENKVEFPVKRRGPYNPRSFGRQITMKFDKDTKILKEYKVEYW